MKDKFHLKSMPMWTLIALIILFIIQIVNQVHGIGGQPFSEVFLQYDHLLVPLDYFFYFWWVLAIFLALFCWYQFFQDHRFITYKLDFIRPMSILWVVLTIIWIILFQYEKFLVAFIFKIFSFLVLFLVVGQLNKRPLTGLDALAIKAPFNLLFGWTTFMLVQNLMILLVSKIANIETSQLWAVIILLIGLIIYLAIIMKINDPFYGAAFFIGYLGILLRHFIDWKADYIITLIVQIILTAMALYMLVQTIIHPKKTPRSKRKYQRDIEE